MKRSPVSRIWTAGLFVAALTCVRASIVHAQTAKPISVIDAQTGAPVAFARITLPASSDRFADELGRFTPSTMAGPLTIRVRSIGFAPLDTTLDVATLAAGRVHLQMHRLPQRLEAIRVTGREVCGKDWASGDVAGDSLLMIIDQLREHAQRSRLLAEGAPFRATFDRVMKTTVNQTAASLALAVRDTFGRRTPPTPQPKHDTVTISSVREWEYAPGALVALRQSSAGDVTQNLRLLQLADFASPTFLANHCFRYRGIEGRGDSRAFRIDYHPIADVKTPDVSGSIYLAAGTYQLRRSTMEMPIASPSDRCAVVTRARMEVETAYRPVGPAVAFIADVKATHIDGTIIDRTCRQLTAVETQHLLGTTNGLTGALAPGLARVALSAAESLRVLDRVRDATNRYSIAWRKEWSLNQLSMFARRRDTSHESVTEPTSRGGVERFLTQQCNNEPPPLGPTGGLRSISSPVVGSSQGALIAPKPTPLPPHLGKAGLDTDGVFSEMTLTTVGSPNPIQDFYGRPVHPHLIAGDVTNGTKVRPIWVPEMVEPSDAQWGIDFDLGVGGRAVIKDRQRKPLVRQLDSAAIQLPGDPWIAGQRIRMLLEQGDVARAVAVADRCQASDWWCGMLDGLISYWTRDLITADAKFQRAFAAMPMVVRCQWNDAHDLFAASERDEYAALSCSQRDSVNDRTWLLSDPLYLEPGNARRAEFFGRKTLVAVRGALPFDERWDWRPGYGGSTYAELIDRYGWPTSIKYLGLRELGDPATGLGNLKPSGTPAMLAISLPSPAERGVARVVDGSSQSYDVPYASIEYWGPQYHTVPPLSAVMQPFAIADSIWDLGPRQVPDTAWQETWDHAWWPQEFMKRDEGPLEGLPHQVAVFRRGNSSYLAAAARWDTTGLGYNAPRTTIFGVVAVDRPDSILGAVADTGAPTRREMLTLAVASRPQILGVEIIPPRGVAGPARRARFGITPPPSLAGLGDNEVGLSDPIMTWPPTSDSTHSPLKDVLPRMLPSSDLVDPQRLGIFWESYGLRAADTSDVAIRLVRYDDRGVLRKALSVVGLGTSTPAGDSVTVHLTQNGQSAEGATEGAGRSIRPTELNLNVAGLPAGRYLLELILQRKGSPTVVSRREFSITRH